MIFAAGLGTRMAPLTTRVPKALIPVRGRPLLAWVLDRVAAAGAKRVVVNTCHFAEQIEEWLGAHAPRGLDVAVSREPTPPGGPWDTGGGLVAARKLFRGDGPILLHAVDVLSDIPLDMLAAAHRSARADLGERLLATLAVQARAASRALLFSDAGLLGWQRLANDGRVLEERRVRESGAARSWAFTGIHFIEPALLELADRKGTFPIRDLYLDAAAKGYVIAPFDASAYDWLDVGTPEKLKEAEAKFSEA